MPQNNQEGVSKISGKDYTHVWKRRNAFLKDIGFQEFIKGKEISSLSHVTTVMEENDQFIHMVCDLTVNFGSDENSVSVQGHGRLYKTGVQSEDAFLIEKCETRSFGRALAVLDYSGKYMASAEEMEDVQAEKAKAEAEKAKAKTGTKVEPKPKAEEPKPRLVREKDEGKEKAVRLDLSNGIGTFKNRLLELGMESQAVYKLWKDEFDSRKIEEVSVDELKKFFNILEESIKVLERKTATG